MLPAFHSAASWIEPHFTGEQMAWVTIGTRKINTALICFVMQEQSALFVQFTGLADAMTLVDDEAVQLWKFIKAEDPPGKRDDKFQMFKRASENNSLELKLDGEVAAAPAKQTAPKPVGPVATSLGSSLHSHTAIPAPRNAPTAKPVAPPSA
jgi:hypothetical protein